MTEGLSRTEYLGGVLSYRNGSDKKYRHLSEREFNRVYYTGFALNKVFDDDDELGDRMLIARRRIVRTFHHATEFYRGRLCSTDNYIIGVGPRQQELNKHIVNRLGRPLVTLKDLPDWMQEFSPKQQELVVHRAQWDILQLQLNAMCSKPLFEIYYDEARGLWQIVQSAIDEYVLQNRNPRHAVKFDQRFEHGMVRSQRINRGRPAGLSVSFAGASLVV